MGISMYAAVLHILMEIYTNQEDRYGISHLPSKYNTKRLAILLHQMIELSMVCFRSEFILPASFALLTTGL
jgi:hypothetical protein